MAVNTFSKKEHLRKNNLIKNVFDKGVLYRAKAIDVYLFKRAEGDNANRGAFICRKHLWQKKNVLRNRIRRVLREAYRKTKHILPDGHDIVIVAKSVKEDTKSFVIEKELSDVFKKYIKK